MSDDVRRAVFLALDDMYCGCGNPEEAVGLVHELLRAAPFYDSRERVKELLPTTGVEMIVLGALDRADLIEHGGNIGGSLTTTVESAAAERVAPCLSGTRGWHEYSAHTRWWFQSQVARGRQAPS